MALLVPKNRATSLLDTGIDSDDTSVIVTTGEGTKFPSTYPFHITIDNEILECTSRSTDTLTVTRAAEGTTAASHTAGATVSLNITAQIITELQSSGAPVFIAASDATTNEKNRAYVSGGTVCSGGDDATTVNSYLTTGKKVILSSGTFHIRNTPLELWASNIVLEGQGQGITNWITDLASYNPYDGVQYTSVSIGNPDTGEHTNITLRGMSFDFNGDAHGADHDHQGITYQYCDNVRIENVAIAGTYKISNNIYTGSKRIYISDMICTGGFTVSTAPCYNYVYSSTAVVIWHKCQYFDSDSAQAMYIDTCASATVMECYFNNCAIAIDPRRGHCYIIGNFITGSTVNAIFTNQDDGSCHDVVITGNHITASCNSWAIYDKGTGTIISNNWIENTHATYNGLITCRGTDAQIFGNKLVSTATANNTSAISLAGSAEHVHIHDNDFDVAGVVFGYYSITTKNFQYNNHFKSGYTKFLVDEADFVEKYTSPYITGIIAPVWVASSTSTDAEKKMALNSGGAVCTNTDDEGIINRFLATGKHVILGSGTFTIGDHPILIDASNEILEGQGIGVTTITVKNSGAPTHAGGIYCLIDVYGTSGTPIDDVTLKGFTLDCNGTGQTAENDLMGVRTTYVDNLHFEHIRFEDMYKNFMYISTGTKRSYTYKCIFTGTSLDGTFSGDDEGSHVGVWSTGGVFRSTECQHFDNTDTQCYYIGTSEAHIDKCYFYNCELQVDFRGSNNSVTNCVSEAGNKNFCMMGGAGATSKNNRVIGNKILNQTAGNTDAVIFDQYGGNIISHNIISTLVDQVGVLMRGSYSDIHDNIFLGFPTSSQAGQILLYRIYGSNPTGNKIHHNTFYSTYVLIDAYDLISDNYFYDNHIVTAPTTYMTNSFVGWTEITSHPNVKEWNNIGHQAVGFITSKYSKMPMVLGAIQDTYVSGSLDNVSISKYTHICYAEVDMDATGAFTAMSDTNLDDVIATVHAAGRKVGFLIDTQTNLSHVVADHLATAGTNFATLLTTYDVDFVIVDDEQAAVTTAEMESFLHELDDHSSGVEIGVAVGWYTYKVTTTTCTDHCDFLWVMAYDMTLPSQAPFHCSLYDAYEAMQYWVDGGYSASKLLMGVPAYAKDNTTVHSSLATYANLYADFHMPPDADIVVASQVSVGFEHSPQTIDGGVAGFNGITTVKRKVDICRRQGYAGVGVWDAAQDLLNDHPSSLIVAIDQENNIALPEVKEDILYENTIVDDASKNSYNITTSGDKAAQTFTPSTTHRVNRVTLSLYRSSGHGQITCTIETTSAGQPTGTALATGIVNFSTLDVNYRRVDFDLGEGCLVESGTKYAIVITINGTINVYWYTGTASSYSGGSHWVYTSSTWTEYSARDMWFQVWAKHPDTPTIKGNSTRFINDYRQPKSGEIRTITGQVLGGSSTIVRASIDNPFPQAVRIMSVDLEITTQGTTSALLCCGVGSDEATDYGATSGQQFFDQMPVDLGTSPPYFRNSIHTATYGKQTNPVQWESGTGNRYLNFYGHTATTNMIAIYTITVMGN